MNGRLYIFHGEGCFYHLVVGSDLTHKLFMVALPGVGRGRATLETTVEACPADAQEFFKAILDGESLRKEFEQRGHY